MFSGLVIHVIDPLNRTGKVGIPAHHVTDTKGLEDYRTAAANHETKDFSLCLLLQKGRCNAGSRCHQVHASPEFVTELRARAAANKNCCAEHGDMHSCGYSSAPQTVVVVPAAADVVSGGEREKRYPVSCFARTSALDNILRVVKSLEVRVPTSKLCRLHAQRRCKFGKDCKNVHLCPDAAETPAAKQPSCPSVDNNTISCGVSCRSGSHPASAVDSPAPRTPRDGFQTELGFRPSSSGCAPLPLDADHQCVVGAGSVSGGERATTHGCSSFFFSDERMWGSSTGTGGADDSILSCPLDMSAFEATIRSLCADLDRAEVSPGCASRVRTQGQLLAELEF